MEYQGIQRNTSYLRNIPGIHKDAEIVIKKHPRNIQGILEQ